MEDVLPSLVASPSQLFLSTAPLKLTLSTWPSTKNQKEVKRNRWKIIGDIEKMSNKMHPEKKPSCMGNQLKCIQAGAQWNSDRQAHMTEYNIYRAVKLLSLRGFLLLLSHAAILQN